MWERGGVLVLQRATWWSLRWAFGQLKNSQPEMAAELAAQIRGLLGAAANVCTRERLCGMKAS